MSAKSAPRARDGSDIVSVVVGTAGHIDHGKSTLVKTLTGIDPDRLKEEKILQGTTDLGFARFDLPDGRTVGVIDVPGHERFVKNMVAGATGIDVVVLVVAANDGIMPQTREHLDILTLLGLEHGLVAITKADLVDAELVEIVKLEVADLVRGTFLEKAPVCPFSSLTRAGFPAFEAALAAVVAKVRPRDATGAFRLPIQRVFTAPGHGTIVTGIPVSGTVRLGDAVEILPPGLAGKVRGIQAYQRDVERARAGHSAALNVTDVDYRAVARGMAVCAPGVFAAESFLEARIQALPRRRRPLKDRSTLRVHVGTTEVLGELVLLEKKELSSGETGLCQLRLVEPVVVAPGDRFIARLHSPLETVGGGTILGASKHRLKAGKPFVIERLTEKEAALDDPDEGILAALDESPKPLKAETLSRLVQRPTAELVAVLAKLAAAGRVVDCSASKGSPSYVTSVRADVARSRVLAALREAHRARPLRLLVPRPEIKSALGLDETLLDATLRRLDEEKVVALSGRSALRLAEHVPVPKGEDARIAQDLLGIFHERAFQPPSVEEALEIAAADDPDAGRAVLEHLVEKGSIVAVSAEVLFGRERYDEAKSRARAVLEKTGFLNSGQFKDELQTTRKFVIPLLEHFDATGFTVREGEGRVLRK